MLKVECPITCPMCGEIHTVTVDFKGWMRYAEGELIQNALPALTPAEREEIISGLCPACQDKIFGGE